MLKAILPQSTRGAIASKIIPKTRDFFGIVDKDYSKFHLDQKYIENIKLLQDRDMMLTYLPKNARVAEIGVHRGKFSQKIVDICKPKELVLIDIWDTAIQPNAKKNIKHVRDTFSKQIEEGLIRVVHGDSAEKIKLEKDNHFDWVYIDADHSYKAVYKELRTVLPKIKAGGIISGHDYNDCYMPALCQYGVVEAVNEFCKEFNWELIYLTNEPDRALSWAIKKV